MFVKPEPSINPSPPRSNTPSRVTTPSSNLPEALNSQTASHSSSHRIATSNVSITSDPNLERVDVEPPRLNVSPMRRTDSTVPPSPGTPCHHFDLHFVCPSSPFLSSLILRCVFIPRLSRTLRVSSSQSPSHLPPYQIRNHH